MFWSGETLEARLPGLSADFRPEAIDCNAWTLTIGKRIYKTPTPAESKSGTHTIKTLTDGEDFPIPPGQFAYLETQEKFKVPNDAMGLISIKADVKLQGLINISGFHVDPGFDGHLVFTVYNAGPSPIHLQQGQAFFLVWFSSLDKASNSIRVKPGKRIDGKLISQVSGKIQSIEDLAERVGKLEEDVNIKHGILENSVSSKISYGSALVGALVGAAVSIVFTYLITAHFSSQAIQEGAQSSSNLSTQLPAATGAAPPPQIPSAQAQPAAAQPAQAKPTQVPPPQAQPSTGG